MDRPARWLSVLGARTAADELRMLNWAVNAGFLSAVALGAAGYALTVDSDISRGWTTAEILSNVGPDLWSRYESLVAASPILAKACISGTVYFLGDLTAQTYEGRSLGDLDRARALRSSACGFLAHGPLSHEYYIFNDWLFGDVLGMPAGPWQTTVAKVAFDQTLWTLFWNSTYYALLGALKLESPRTIAKTIRDTWWQCMSAGWKLWPLAHLVTYGVVPQEHRLLWVDAVEIVWVTLLSYIGSQYARSRERGEEDALEELALSAAAAGDAAGAGDAAAAGRGPAARVADGAPTQVALPGHVSGGDPVEELTFAVGNQNRVILIDAEGTRTVVDGKALWDGEGAAGAAGAPASADGAAAAQSEEVGAAEAARPKRVAVE